MSTNVFCYLRVSTSTQSVESQRLQLKAYCESRGWSVVKYWADNGVSGDAIHRPEFDEMLKQAYLGKVQAIVVYQLSRFGRSLHSVIATVQDLSDHGVGVVAISENISTLEGSSPYAKLMLSVFAALGEIELDLIRERVRSGVARSIASGTRFGRPHAGFDLGKLLELKQQGLSTAKIARELGVSASTVKRNVAKIKLGQKSTDENNGISGS